MRRITKLSLVSLVAVSSLSISWFDADPDMEGKVRETSVILSVLSFEMNMLFERHGTFGVGAVTFDDGPVNLPFEGSFVKLISMRDGFSAVISGLPSDVCEKVKSFRSVTIDDPDGLDASYQVGTGIGLAGAGIIGANGCNGQPLTISYKPAPLIWEPLPPPEIDA